MYKYTSFSQFEPVTTELQFNLVQTAKNWFLMVRSSFFGYYHRQSTTVPVYLYLAKKRTGPDLKTLPAKTLKTMILWVFTCIFGFKHKYLQFFALLFNCIWWYLHLNMHYIPNIHIQNSSLLCKISHKTPFLIIFNCFFDRVIKTSPNQSRTGPGYSPA
jgi:hypothetical protein